MKVYLLCISVVAVPLWQTLNEPIPDSNTINVCIKYYIIKWIPNPKVVSWGGGSEYVDASSFILLVNLSNFALVKAFVIDIILILIKM